MFQSHFNKDLKTAQQQRHWVSCSFTSTDNKATCSLPPTEAAFGTHWQNTDLQREHINQHEQANHPFAPHELIFQRPLKIDQGRRRLQSQTRRWSDVFQCNFKSQPLKKMTHAVTSRLPVRVWFFFFIRRVADFSYSSLFYALFFKYFLQIRRHEV